MADKSKTSLDKHKENYGYVQYNRLVKRAWFGRLDKLIKKLRAEDKKQLNQKENEIGN